MLIKAVIWRTHGRSATFPSTTLLCIGVSSHPQKRETTTMIGQNFCTTTRTAPVTSGASGGCVHSLHLYDVSPGRSHDWQGHVRVHTNFRSTKQDRDLLYRLVCDLHSLQGGRTRSAHSSLYWLSAILHCSPNLVLYSHHFHGTPLSFASLNTHSCRRFSCSTNHHLPLQNQTNIFIIVLRVLAPDWNYSRSVALTQAEILSALRAP